MCLRCIHRTLIKMHFKMNCSFKMTLCCHVSFQFDSVKLDSILWRRKWKSYKNTSSITCIWIVYIYRRDLTSHHWYTAAPIAWPYVQRPRPLATSAIDIYYMDLSLYLSLLYMYDHFKTAHRVNWLTLIIDLHNGAFIKYI